MLPARILGTGSALDGPAVSTLTVTRAAMPDRDPVTMQARTGIDNRRWVGPDTSAASLGATALSQALDAAGLAPPDLRRIIFVSSVSGDQLIPATANALARDLGLADHCGVFDINNACTGYLTAFDLAARLVATGESPIGVVASEVFSRHIGLSSPRSYVVMGDAAGAMVIGNARRSEGVLATDFGNDGTQMNAATLWKSGWNPTGRDPTGRDPTGRDPTGSVDGTEFLEFGVNAITMAGYAMADVARSAESVLNAAGLTSKDVDWLVPHQANGPMLKGFCKALNIPFDRTLPVVAEIGSVGAASVAFGLDHLWRSGRVQPGQLVLLVAVGGGTSRGAVLYRVAP